jgi:molybdate transport system substrate-binding protein
VLLSAKRVASIDPKGGGTSGPLIAKLLERLGVADHLNATGLLCKTGKDVVRAIASGDATFGVSQATEFIGTKDVRFAGYLAPDVQAVSVYSGAASSFAASPDAARAFIRFLKSPAGAEHFRRAGWDPAATD